MIKTSQCTIALPEKELWEAYDDKVNDGNHVGYGATEQEAIDDLKRLLQEKAEYEYERDYWRRLGMEWEKDCSDDH